MNTTTTTQASWQKILSQAISDIDQLCRLLNINPDLCEKHTNFSLRVPIPFINRMEKGNINDPLLRQVLPINAENILTPGFSNDPLNELNANKVPGLLHKYHGRVLLMPNPSCAVNCRYCFRRHFPYKENTPGLEGWQQALDYISQDDSIEEVILSGGDPLMTKDHLLTQFIKRIESIAHVKFCRIHTRLPIVIPQRVTPELLTTLANSRLKVVMVVHCNHPNEIDAAVADAFAKLNQHQITLLNQSVLLKNINDDTNTLMALNKKLFLHGVMPYYLHLPDRIQGTAHFDVEEKLALELLNVLRAKLPGYMVPTLVKEIAGEANKTIIC